MGKTKAIMNRTTDLMGSNAQKELTAMASKLQHLLAGGKRLNKSEAVELAVYAYMTDLNPFNNEVYYIPRVGPYPGIAGYTRKAIEQMEYEGGETARGYRLNFDDRPAEPNEADFDVEKGDIAYFTKMTNTIDTENWQQKKLEVAQKYKELGADFQEAIAQAEKDVGPKPFTTGVGVVDHRENFAASGKPEMWDRHERAKKRAHKNAIRKRFTMVMIPEPDEDQPGEIVDVRVVDNIMGRLDEMEEEREKYFETHSADDSIKELGFDQDNGDDAEPDDDMIDGEFSDPELEPEPEPQPEKTDGEKLDDIDTDAVPPIHLDDDVTGALDRFRREQPELYPKGELDWETAYAYVKSKDDISKKDMQNLMQEHGDLRICMAHLLGYLS